jgi:hypothetical protein
VIAGIRSDRLTVRKKAMAPVIVNYAARR